jgi:hypothetical protein
LADAGSDMIVAGGDDAAKKRRGLNWRIAGPIRVGQFGRLRHQPQNRFQSEWRCRCTSACILTNKLIHVHMHMLEFTGFIIASRICIDYMSSHSSC